MTASTTEIQDCLKAGALDEADRLVIEALQQDPSNAQLLLLKGDIAARRGRLDAALTAFKDALPHHPKKDRVRLRMLSTLIRLEAWNDVEAAMANLESDISRFRAALMTWNPAQALVLARRLRETDAQPVADWCGPYLELLFELNLFGEANAVVVWLTNQPTMAAHVRRYAFWIAFETRGPVAALAVAAAAQYPESDSDLEWCSNVIALLWPGQGPGANAVWSSATREVPQGGVSRFFARVFRTASRMVRTKTRQQSPWPEGSALRDRCPTGARAPLPGVVAKLRSALDAAILLHDSRQNAARMPSDRRGRAVPWLIGQVPTSVIRNLIAG